jgi:hypothetical protein
VAKAVKKPVSEAPVRPRASSEFSKAEDLRAAGKKLRDTVPFEAHGRWRAEKGRIDPIDILHAADATRLPDLVPLRYGRMLQSPFTFYRGSAGVMAADLSRMPTTGIHVQACGDAHLMNFGGFATPERQLILDVNDLDETLPAPWEWDVKRLVTSFVLAARSNGLSDANARDAATACAGSYRRTMHDFSTQDVLETWYARLDAKTLLAMLPQSQREVAAKRIAKASARASAELVYPKLVEEIGGQARIHDTPPRSSIRRSPRTPTIWTCAGTYSRNTGKHWRTTGAFCSIATTWSTWRLRWLALAA